MPKHQCMQSTHNVFPFLMNNNQHLLGLQCEFWIATLLGLQNDAHLSTWKLSAHKTSDPILENSKTSLGYHSCPTLLIITHCWHVYWLFKRTHSSLMTSTFLCVWYLISLLIFLHLIKNMDPWVESFMSRVDDVKVKCEQFLYVCKKIRGKCPAPWRWVLHRAYTRNIAYRGTGYFYREWNGLQ